MTNVNRNIWGDIGARIAIITALAASSSFMINASTNGILGALLPIVVIGAVVCIIAYLVIFLHTVNEILETEIYENIAKDSAKYTFSHRGFFIFCLITVTLLGLCAWMNDWSNYREFEAVLTIFFIFFVPTFILCFHGIIYKILLTKNVSRLLAIAIAFSASMAMVVLSVDKSFDQKTRNEAMEISNWCYVLISSGSKYDEMRDACASMANRKLERLGILYR